MNTRRDPDTAIKEFIHEGPTELPARSFDAVRAAIDQTRQWVVIGPWREPQMIKYARFGLAAAAIVLIAFVGIRFLPGGSIGPGSTPSPTAAPTPIPLTTGVDAPLAAGTYVTELPFRVRMTFTLPEGWRGNMGGPNAVFLSKSAGQSLSFTLFDKVYTDPCHYDEGLMDPLPGPSAEDLVSALENLPGLTVTRQPDYVIDGFTAKQLTMAAPASFAGCTLAEGSKYRIWELPLGATNDMLPGQTQRIWIVDVHGQRLVIAQEVGGESGVTPEIEAILDSIQFLP